MGALSPLKLPWFALSVTDDPQFANQFYLALREVFELPTAFRKGQSIVEPIGL